MEEDFFAEEAWDFFVEEDFLAAEHFFFWLDFL